MHPILHEILFTPMGWLLIGVTIVSFGIPLYLGWFFAKKIREEQAQAGKPKPDMAQQEPRSP